MKKSINLASFLELGYKGSQKFEKLAQMQENFQL
jgi:hypothetical protein